MVQQSRQREKSPDRALAQDEQSAAADHVGFADDELTGQAEPSGPRQLLTFIGEATLAVVVALVITALLRVFVFQIFQVPSGSMEQTLELRDRIVAVRLADFERGDIVVFEDPPAEWMGEQPAPTNPVRRVLEGLYLLPDSTQGYLVKRVIGMPGDHVRCCDADGQITINGVALDETAYLFTDEAGQPVDPSLTPFDVVVPQGHIFVLGDHRDRSGDSRLHLCEEPVDGAAAGMNGFAPISGVVGPVTHTILPFDRFRNFDTPASFEAIPEPSDDAPAAPILGEGTCELP
ncbi:MAG: signal peptidase I [Brooklawnia sp.]|jgi:signal peptidase I